MLVDDFKKKYKKLKKKKLSDRDIAEMMFISHRTLCVYKKKYKIVVPNLLAGRPRKTDVTEKEFKEAEARGISRKRVSARITQCGWSKERALTEGVGVSVGKKGRIR